MGAVLAGGRSSRMGTAKADLEWHGSTLLRRTTEVLARVVDRVLVVRASGQVLPALGRDVVVRDDPREGRGPLQGIAVALVAAGHLGAEVAFVCSTDLPLLHPAYVRAVLTALTGDVDVALPVARGHRQPLAAAYRSALGRSAEELVAADRLRPAFLLEQCRVRVLDETALRADAVVAAHDPDLDSLVNVNDPADYALARARPAPEVVVRVTPTGPAALVRAATLREAADAVGLVDVPAALLHGRPYGADGALPLVAGDEVVFLRAGPGS